MRYTIIMDRSVGGVIELRCEHFDSPLTEWDAQQVMGAAMSVNYPGWEMVGVVPFSWGLTRWRPYVLTVGPLLYREN